MLDLSPNNICFDTFAVNTLRIYDVVSDVNLYTDCDAECNAVTCNLSIQEVVRGRSRSDNGIGKSSTFNPSFNPSFNVPSRISSCIVEVALLMFDYNI